jgi:hypothetical protein
MYTIMHHERTDTVPDCLWSIVLSIHFLSISRNLFCALCCLFTRDGATETKGETSELKQPNHLRGVCLLQQACMIHLAVRPVSMLVSQPT